MHCVRGRVSHQPDKPWISDPPASTPQMLSGTAGVHSTPQPVLVTSVDGVFPHLVSQVASEVDDDCCPLWGEESLPQLKTQA